MRFKMTAAAVARDRELGRESSDLTLRNKEKVTRFRKEGESAFESMVERIAKIKLAESAKETESGTKDAKDAAPPA